MSISRRACLRILGGGAGFAGLGILAACTPAAPPAATTAPTSPLAAKPAATDVPKPANTAAPAAPTSAPKPTTAPATTAPGGQIVVAEPLTLDTFDPIMHSNFNNWYAWQLAYETLTVVSPDGKIQPQLATTWDATPDGLTFTFKVRPGVKFHDGSPLTADDVVFTFQRLRDQGIPYAKDRLKSIDSVAAVDAVTAQFKLSKKDASFLNNLSDPFVVGSAILSRKAASATEPATKMVGTGPYKMVSYAPNSELVFERNADYWQAGVPKAARLTVRYVKEAQSAVAALMAGDVSVIWPTPETYLVLKDNSRAKLLSVPTASTYQINMGSVKPPLDKVDVRRAIASSIDRDAVVKLALLGQAAPSGPFPPSHPWAVPLDKQSNYQRDTTKAKQLLAGAGYPDGLSLSFMYPSTPDTYGRIAEVLQSQLAESGIKVSLESLESAVWLDKLVKANYDLTFTNPPYFADPSLYVVPRAGRQGPTPPELQALLDKAAAASFDEQPDLYRQIQNTEAELVYPFTGVVAENKWVAYRPDLVQGAAIDYTQSRRMYFGLAPA
jgi:ABC-type transport system substrate-binding protein